MRMFVIADPDTILAFGMAGIAGRAVEDPAQVPAALRALDRESFALVLITEALARENRETIERLLIEPGGLMILEIPDRHGPKPGRVKTAERILSLLRR